MRQPTRSDGAALTLACIAGILATLAATGTPAMAGPALFFALAALRHMPRD